MKAQILVHDATYYMEAASELLWQIFSAPGVIDALKGDREQRVAVVNDEVVGYITFARKIDYRYWDLHWLASSAEFRGHGIGRLLVDHMRAHVMLHDGSAVRVETPAGSMKSLDSSYTPPTLTITTRAAGFACTSGRIRRIGP